MKSLRNSALGLTLGVAAASTAFADGHAKECREHSELSGVGNMPIVRFS